MPHYHSISQLIPKVVRLLEIMTVITERRFKLAFAGKLDGCYGRCLPVPVVPMLLYVVILCEAMHDQICHRKKCSHRQKPRWSFVSLRESRSVETPFLHTIHSSMIFGDAIIIIIMIINFPADHVHISEHGTSIPCPGGHIIPATNPLNLFYELPAQTLLHNHLLHLPVFVCERFSSSR